MRQDVINKAAHRAKCDECPLQGCPRVPTRRPELPNPVLAIVGEAPGSEEVYAKRPFVGESGRQLDAAFERLGIPKELVFITNACQCRPFKKTTATEWRQAITACRPRLEKELQYSGVKAVLAAGATAFRAVSDKFGQPLLDWIGAPYKIPWAPQITYVPSIHPSFILRGQPQYWPVFWILLKRAWDIAQDQKKPWRWQTLYYYGKDETKTIHALQRILRAKKGTPVGIDIETGGSDPVHCPITAIGVGTSRVTVSIAWPPERHFSKPSNARHARSLIKRILARKALPKIAHNGNHDVLGLEANGMPVNGFKWDTILLHHVAANTQRHSLGFVSQIEFHCDAWKKEFKVGGKAEKGLARFLNAKKGELTKYNAKDTAILPRLLPPLRKRAFKQTHNGKALYNDLFKRAQIASQMQADGARMNLDQKDDWARRLKRRIEYARRQISIVGQSFREDGWGATKANPEGVTWEKFNPKSGGQLHELYFEHLDLDPVSYSETTGVASLTADHLLMFAGNPDPVVRDVSRAVLRFRKWSKLYDTYVKNPQVYDGFFHPQFKVWGTKGGRWASEGPNFQNIPKTVRDLIIARPGGWIIEADYSQLELRIVALLSGDEKLLKWYANNEDVHAKNRDELFEPPPRMTEKALDDLRTLAKRLVYGCNYGGSAVTIWSSLVVDAPDLSLTAVKKFLELWYVMHPRIRMFQEKLLDIAYRDDYVECLLSGRRQYFWGQVEATKVLNYPIQGSGADIIDGVIPIIAEELEPIEDTYMIAQVHDALLVDSKHPVEVCEILQEHMEHEVVLGEYKTKIPIDFKIGPDWKNMAKYKNVQEVREAFNTKDFPLCAR